MKAHKMEILAPAGNRDMLRAAVFSGADCVYLGLRGFNARGGAANFDGEQLAEAVAFCHARNCKVYAAVNTLVLPGEEAALKNTLAGARQAGCDAVIVQDLQALRLAQAAGLVVHASTQMSVHSPAGLRMLAELGVVRAILARELSLAEIEEMAATSPIELEVFVHGALCVSVSGQCYASAFLGGRSANRGACAGPCRLPFSARPCTPGQLEGLVDTLPLNRPATARAREEYALSLKDLSILEALPALAKLGVAAVKLEGRLRGPEYCAVAVDSARKALNGEEYDKQLLLSVFSRNGFTDGWFSGKNGGDMFGVRSETDVTATKRALPKARALYRREMPRVPVKMQLCAGAASGELIVTDGIYTVAEKLDGPFAPAAQAAQDGMDRLRQALQKTGGTPFYCAEIPEIIVQDVYVPAPVAGEARRRALARLLELRESAGIKGDRNAVAGKCTARLQTCPADELLEETTNSAAGENCVRPQAVTNRVGGTPRAASPTERLCVSCSGRPLNVLSSSASLLSSWGEHSAEVPISAGRNLPLQRQGAGAPRPALRARFEHVAQMPENAPALCESLLLPLFEAAQVPENLRAKTVLWLPRALFGKEEEKAVAAIAATAGQGFAGYEANNIAHLHLLQGRAVCGGFGLNAANAGAVQQLALLGCRQVSLSPELNLPQMRAMVADARLSGGPATDALCYGHLPLFFTRACPLKQKTGCAACPKAGVLLDRKGCRMPLLCRDGMRSVYNPVPLWLEAKRLPTDAATLYFTIESRARAAGVLADFAAGKPAAGGFTRGLYIQGVKQ